jgi:DNA modification methylase
MSVRLLIGDCRAMLLTLPDGSVHCCVTSPPYFGLRDYGMTAQIGLETTPAEYVAQLVDVFREVRRVLRDDGTLWLNLGDSYAGSWGARGREDGTNAARPDLEKKHGTDAPNRHGFPVLGVKPKDLIGIPWRVAFALQADGWYLRQDIIWHKPNPMPESVRDRCTKAHEYVFLLAKSERYHFDSAAIAEASVGMWNSARSTLAANGIKNVALNKSGQRRTAGSDTHHEDTDRTGRNKRSVWTIPTQPYTEAHFATMARDVAETCIKAGCPVGGVVLDPFGGAGTTGLVADGLQRDALLIELNPAYADLSRERITSDGPLFADVSLLGAGT